MSTKKPNLLDPDFEPTDDQLRSIAEAALKLVRKRAAAASKVAPGRKLVLAGSNKNKQEIAKRKTRQLAKRRSKVPALAKA